METRCACVSEEMVSKKREQEHDHESNMHKDNTRKTSKKNDA
jgi:hypothetical protein